MAVTDPIADMLTRIRNAIMAGHQQLSMPSSKIKVKIADILQDEGYLNDVSFVDEGPQGSLVIQLRYDSSGRNAIKGLKRVSRPGRRVYRGVRDIPRIQNGLGISVLSTSQGILSDKTARQSNAGGEIICHIW